MQGKVRLLRYVLAVILLVGASLALSPTVPAQAATTYVWCNSPFSLQGAVATANATPGMDSIVLNPYGAEECLYNLVNKLVITDDLTLMGNGATLDGHLITADDVIWVESGTTFLMGDLAIRNATDDGITSWGETRLSNITIYDSNDFGYATVEGRTFLTNVTLSGNGSQGLWAYGGSTFASFVSIVGNGYGAYVGVGGGRLDMRSSVVAYSHTADCTLLSGTLNNDGGNYHTDGTCGGFHTALQPVNPELHDYGGPVPVHEPQSLLLEAVTCAYDSNGDDVLNAIIPWDARYVPRPFDINFNGVDSCDAGAVEKWPTVYTVDSTANSLDDDLSDGLCETAAGTCTLKAAVMQANAQPDWNLIVLAEGQLHAPSADNYVILEDVAIQGNGAHIYGAAAFGGDLFQINDGTAYMDGLHISNAPDDGIRVGDGSEEGARLILADSVLDYNGDGVLLFGERATASIGNSTFLHQTHDGIQSARNTTVVNSIIGYSGDEDLNVFDDTTTTVMYSITQDVLPAAINGGHNSTAYPEFINPGAGDYRLAAISPAINAGDFGLMHNDVTDRDSDGRMDERCPLDVANGKRIDGGLLDMGAYEAPHDPFVDVPSSLPAPFMEDWVEFFYQTGITSGKVQCSDGTTAGPGELLYCPGDHVTRGEMAVFILRAIEYPGLPYTPPGDPSDPFADVFTGSPALPAPFMEDWIEEFYAREITGGKVQCSDGTTAGPGELLYCPGDKVTRGEMAVFIIRALEYPNLPYTPTNDPSDPFADVPSALPAPFMEAWVEEFYARGITTGKFQCSDGTTAGPGEILYCPVDNVTRGEMAVFILRAFDAIPDPAD